MSPAYFGRPRPARGWQQMDHAEPPVGRACSWCSDPIQPNDDGVIDDTQLPWHADCWVLQKLRVVRSDAGEPEPGESRLVAAERAVRAFEREGRL